MAKKLKKSKKAVAKKKKPVATTRKALIPEKAAGPARASKARKPVGRVTHFYTEIGVAIVKFSKAIPVGVELRFQGATTDFDEIVKSMQYEHKPIAKAPKGKQIGIKVKKRVREGDSVYLG